MRNEKRIVQLAQRVRAERARFAAGETSGDLVGDAEGEYLVEAIVVRRAELTATLRSVAAGLEACDALEEQLRGGWQESPEAELLRAGFLANV
jgi:hypothetical protein